MATRQQARRVKDHLREILRDSPGYSGAGLVDADGDFHVRINVERNADAAGIPVEVDGVEVDVEVVGAIEPQLPA